MTNRIKALTLAIVMAVAVAVPFAFAQTSGEGRKEGRKAHARFEGRRGGDRAARMFRGLDLTDAQKAQLKQIRENHRQSVAPLREQIRAKRKEIRQASQGGSFDEALVRQKLTEIAPLEAKLMGEQLRLRQEMLSVLTPEQRTQLEQRREQFKSRRSERRSGNAQQTL